MKLLFKILLLSLCCCAKHSPTELTGGYLQTDTSGTINYGVLPQLTDVEDTDSIYFQTIKTGSQHAVTGAVLKSYMSDGSSTIVDGNIFAFSNMATGQTPKYTALQFKAYASSEPTTITDNQLLLVKRSSVLSATPASAFASYFGVFANFLFKSNINTALTTLWNGAIAGTLSMKWMEVGNSISVDGVFRAGIWQGALDKPAGFIGGNYGVGNSTLPAGWTLIDGQAGIAGFSQKATGTANTQYDFDRGGGGNPNNKWDSLLVIYKKKPAGGTFTIQVAGPPGFGTFVLKATQSTVGTDGDFGILSVGGLGDNPNVGRLTVTVAGSDGVEILDVVTIRSVKGVRADFWAHSGWSVYNYIGSVAHSAPVLWTPQVLSLISALNYNVFLIELGTNDYDANDATQYAADLTTMTNDILTINPSAIIFYMNLPYWQGTDATRIDAYNAAINSVAVAKGGCVVNVNKIFGSFAVADAAGYYLGDGKHYTTLGKNAIMTKFYIDLMP